MHGFRNVSGNSFLLNKNHAIGIDGASDKAAIIHANPYLLSCACGGHGLAGGGNTEPAAIDHDLHGSTCCEQGWWAHHVLAQGLTRGQRPDGDLANEILCIGKHGGAVFGPVHLGRDSVFRTQGLACGQIALCHPGRVSEPYPEQYFNVPVRKN